MIYLNHTEKPSIGNTFSYSGSSAAFILQHSVFCKSSELSVTTRGRETNNKTQCPLPGGGDTRKILR